MLSVELSFIHRKINQSLRCDMHEWYVGKMKVVFVKRWPRRSQRIRVSFDGIQTAVGNPKPPFSAVPTLQQWYGGHVITSPFATEPSPANRTKRNETTKNKTKNKCHRNAIASANVIAILSSPPPTDAPIAKIWAPTNNFSFDWIIGKSGKW